jgi:flagellar biosynthesis GTPase FlhF
MAGLVAGGAGLILGAVIGQSVARKRADKLYERNLRHLQSAVEYEALKREGKPTLGYTREDFDAHQEGRGNMATGLGFLAGGLPGAIIGNVASRTSEKLDADRFQAKLDARLGNKTASWREDTAVDPRGEDSRYIRYLKDIERNEREKLRQRPRNAYAAAARAYYNKPEHGSAIHRQAMAEDLERLARVRDQYRQTVPLAVRQGINAQATRDILKSTAAGGLTAAALGAAVKAIVNNVRGTKGLGQVSALAGLAGAGVSAGISGIRANRDADRAMNAYMDYEHLRSRR